MVLQEVEEREFVAEDEVEESDLSDFEVNQTWSGFSWTTAVSRRWRGPDHRPVRVTIVSGGKRPDDSEAKKV